MAAFDYFIVDLLIINYQIIVGLRIVRFADFVSVGNAWQKNKSANGNSSTQNSFNLGSSLGLGYLSNIGIGARWILK